MDTYQNKLVYFLIQNEQRTSGLTCDCLNAIIDLIGCNFVDCSDVLLQYSIALIVNILLFPYFEVVGLGTLKVRKAIGKYFLSFTHRIDRLNWGYKIIRFYYSYALYLYEGNIFGVNFFFVPYFSIASKVVSIQIDHQLLRIDFDLLLVGLIEKRELYSACKLLIFMVVNIMGCS